MIFSKWAPKLRGFRNAALASTLGAMLVASVATTSSAVAAPLHTMSLEGQLLTTGGTPVPDGTYTVTVSFYKTKSDVQALFSQVLPIKTVAGGFVMTLGLKTPLATKDFYSGDAAWVGITVDSDPELDRIPVNHIAYAMRADVAGDLQCSGCLKAEHLASSVLAPYAKTVDLKFALSTQSCPSGSAVAGIDAAGKVLCAKDNDSKYSGKDFVTSGQSCAAGQVVAGVDAAGKVKCVSDADADTKYTGKDFALSGQACPSGQVVTGIDAAGKATCAIDQKGQTTGKDFALSNQSCGSGLVMKGVDANGKAVCVKDSAPTAPADKLSDAQVTNLQADKLAGGTTPWATTKYDVDNEWLRERGDDATFKQFGGKRQMVFRTDGVAEYNTGIGNYPFVFQYGGDVKANSVMAINGTGQLWLKAYGWLHTAFAKAGTTCPTGQVVRGFSSAGEPLCILDQKGESTGKDFALSNQSCGTGLVARGIDAAGKIVCIADKDTKNTYTAGTGIAISGTTISGNFTYLDTRYVNTNEANSITSAMVNDGSLTGSDIANESLTGSDIKNGTVTGSDVASSTLTGTHVLNESLTGSDIKNGSITGSDIASSTITGAHVANESITSADVKNGSLTYSDTNTDSIQRRVAASCPAGQAIRAISNTGAVTCETEVGDQQATYSGPVAKGNWYRIAATGGGYEVAATFTVWDTSYENQVTFRVGISSGYEPGMHFNLISSSRYSAVLIERVRIVEGGSTSPHYIDIKVANTATMYVKIDNNNHQNAFTPQIPKLLDSSDTVSGYSVRQFDMDRLINVGDYKERLTMDRAGKTTISTNTGSLEFNTSSAAGWLNTDRGYLATNKELRVDTGLIGSYNEDLQLRTSGTTRIHVSNSTGNVGIGTNASTSYKLYVNGKTRLNDELLMGANVAIDKDAGWHRSYGATGWYNGTYGGGIYMTDTSWLRIYNNKGLLTTGQVQAGSLYTTGNVYSGGSVGIGDASPDYPLDIEKTSTNWLVALENKSGNDTNVYLGHPTAGLYIKTSTTDTTTNYVAEFRNHSGSAMTIDNNRRVGIRNENPSYELDVSGTVRATNFYVGTTSLAAYIDARVKAYVRANCTVTIGQRDNTPSNTSSTYNSPTHYAYMRADGRGYANSYGIYDNTSPYTASYASFRMTGDVNSDDRLYIRFVCL